FAGLGDQQQIPQSPAALPPGTDCSTRTGHAFFPVGDGIRLIVAEWITYLREEKLWGNNDPLFPATRISHDESMQFQVTGIDRKHWRNATPIRKIFRKAFTDAGLPYFNPHSFRNTLVRLGQQVCQTPEQFKAWSQNLGHEKVLTTFLSYGNVECQRQGEIIRDLATPRQNIPPDIKALLKVFASEMRD
ncbi:hypothetical protein SAMN05216326_1654, partial [Nitrosomonas marina]